MRPQETTTHPEVVRRLRIISMNTAIEVDLFGKVKSTHVLGGQIMNALGVRETSRVTPISRSLLVLRLRRGASSLLLCPWRRIWITVSTWRGW
jgi:hypothetical protein